MYDGLRVSFGLACPGRGEVSVPLSSFRSLERLPGPAHPALYRVRFACRCGGEHDGLVSHDDLDWSPLAGGDEAFYNVMTGRLEPVSHELLDLAATRIRRGEWPWSFWCVAERRPQPVFPSAFRLVAPGDGGVLLGACCPSCARTSVNLCTAEHVDVPFHNDAAVGVVEHVFPGEGADPVAVAAAVRAGGYATRWRALAA